MRNNLESLIHNDGEISIKDKDVDLDISLPKWDFLMDLLVDYSEYVLFYGLKLNYYDDIKENIKYLADEILINKHEEFETVLLKIGERHIKVSRSFLGRVWSQYESPSLIFLSNSDDVDKLVSTISKKRFYEGFLTTIEGLCIIYQEYEPNVLWISSNDEDLKKRINFLGQNK
ncbi:hypothetical protein [Pedobacter chitinilyticus]|uniref:Uncharacterized protein n=1 Tax=Pedobacter chitinilyticus TaxID=2233776 RepID=A0A3S3PMZ4_9SPHI|nr:hypothetical protein [Pedobacter chitinilyticus]RWU06140.1 hypothetical protein DPV69_12655 [Pedobacter chitinilyticus]